MIRKKLGLFFPETSKAETTRIGFMQEREYSYVSGETWRAPDGSLVDFNTNYKKLKSIKATPPDPVWQEPDYLPHYELACNATPNVFSDGEVFDLGKHKNYLLIFDIECYPNYFLIIFKCFYTNKIMCYELQNEQVPDHYQLDKLNYIANNFCLIGFNSNNYDIPLLELAVTGLNTRTLHEASHNIIVDKMWASDVLKKFNVKKNWNINSIDIMNVAPLDGSLKIYSGRIHTKRMQDLPFIPGVNVTADQMIVLRWYCLNDLQSTYDVFKELDQQMKLRYQMSQQYVGQNGRNLDLRSKSDAQIAEAVIKSEIEKLTGKKCEKIQIPAGTIYKYKTPDYIKFETPRMRSILQTVECCDFVLDEGGKLIVPKQLANLRIIFDGVDYKPMGIGGLHSNESQVCHVADDNTRLAEIDAESYYPWIVLNQGYYPKHLGEVFLTIYRNIVESRLKAKKLAKTGETEEIRKVNKIISDSLKIVINGSFGKLGNRWSVLFSPDLMLQVTLTGQLSLYMLVERLELAGIPVVSGNTDGIVVKCPNDRIQDRDEIVRQWEKESGYKTEETIYKMLLSRDVNNYIGVSVKSDGSLDAKTKGIFGKPGLFKNPLNEICIEAIEKYLIDQTPLVNTIKSCTDITKFVTVRTVKSGAVKDGVFLGKAIRWYYSVDEDGTILVANSGYNVPRSEGAKPLMELPDQFPNDVDYDWYITESMKLLEQAGITLFK